MASFPRHNAKINFAKGKKSIKDKPMKARKRKAIDKMLDLETQLNVNIHFTLASKKESETN